MRKPLQFGAAGHIAVIEQSFMLGWFGALPSSGIA